MALDFSADLQPISQQHHPQLGGTGLQPPDPALFADNEVGRRSATSSLAGWVSAGDPGADAQGPGDAGTADKSPTQSVHGQTSSRQQPGGGVGGHQHRRDDPRRTPALLGTGRHDGGHVSRAPWGQHGRIRPRLSNPAAARIQIEGSGKTPSTSNCRRWKCHTLLSSRHRKATSSAWLSTCTST